MAVVCNHEPHFETFPDTVALKIKRVIHNFVVSARVVVTTLTKLFFRGQITSPFSQI